MTPSAAASPRTVALQAAEEAYRFWRVLLAVVMLAPGIPLGFTDADSVVSPALLMLGAYVARRAVTGWRGAPRPRTWFGSLIHLVTIYFLLHAAWFLVGEAVPLAFLTEAQWAAYLFGFAVLVHDLRALPDAAARITQFTIATLAVEAGVAVVTAFTGPIPAYYHGTSYEGRLGLGLYRATGTLLGANPLAGVLACGLVLIVFARDAELPVAGRFRPVLLILMATGLLTTQSKGGVAALLFGLLVGLAAKWARGELRVRPWMPALTLALSAVLIWAHVDTIVDVLEEDYAKRWLFTEAVLARYVLGGPFRWIVGFGFRQTAVLEPYSNGLITAHNSYVSFLAEAGAPGLLALLALVLFAIARTARRGQLGWAAGISALAAHSYTESFWYGYQYVFLLVCALGLPIAARRAGADAPPLAASSTSRRPSTSGRDAPPTLDTEGPR